MGLLAFSCSPLAASRPANLYPGSLSDVLQGRAQKLICSSQAPFRILWVVSSKGCAEGSGLGLWGHFNFLYRVWPRLPLALLVLRDTTKLAACPLDYDFYVSCLTYVQNVWDICWSTDSPLLCVAMEKDSMVQFQGLASGETLPGPGIAVAFHDMDVLVQARPLTMPEVLDVPAAKLVKKGQHLTLLLLQSHNYCGPYLLIVAWLVETNQLSS